VNATTKAVLENFINAFHDRGICPNTWDVNPTFRSMYDALVADGHLVKIDDRYFAKGHPYVKTYIDAQQAKLENDVLKFQQKQAGELAQREKETVEQSAKIEALRAALLSNENQS
jgi:hypothetical protein